MKIGSCLSPFARYGEQRYEKMKQYGFTCLDFSTANTESVYYTASEDEMVAMLRAETELAAASGVTVHQMHGPWRWPAQDATVEDRAERMEKMKKSIRMCAVMNCKYWVIHPVFPFGFQERANADLAAKTWEINLAFMRELLQTAHEQDVIVCFENMPMPIFSLGKVEDVIRFVKEINDPYLKVCLDTGHAAVTKESVGDAIRALGKDLLATLHIHDNDGRFDQHRLPYFGVIDWEDVKRALAEIGFEGSFSYEVTPPKAMPDPFYTDIMFKTYADIARHLMGEK